MIKSKLLQMLLLALSFVLLACDHVVHYIKTQIYATVGLNQYICQELSRQIGLDNDRLINCLTNQAAVDFVDANRSYGETLDVITPPTFFLGLLDKGILSDVIMMIGARPYNEFAGVIEVLLTLDAEKNRLKAAYNNKVDLTWSNGMIPPS